MTMCNYRITPVMLHGQPCDGVWTDGSIAWIGFVRDYTFANGRSKRVVLPLTDHNGVYVSPPPNWHALVIEPLD